MLNLENQLLMLSREKAISSRELEYIFTAEFDLIFTFDQEGASEQWIGIPLPLGFNR